MITVTKELIGLTTKRVNQGEKENAYVIVFVKKSMSKEPNKGHRSKIHESFRLNIIVPA